jgi:hypothetical protein
MVEAARLPAGRIAQQLLERQKRNGLKWAAGLLGPKAAAAFASTRLELGNFRPGRDTVLCLTRPHFSLDVEQLRKLDRVNWIAVNLILLGEMQRAWARPEMQQQTYYQGTTADPAYAASWQRMNEFALELLQRINARYPFDALLCANIDYWQAEAFRHASHTLGLPFLVLSRENLLTRYDEQLILERYRGFRFEGDAVFGPWMREALLRAGCVREEQIVVTGAPRLDVWRGAASAGTPRDRVVLISFADPNYYAPEAFGATLQRFVAAAARNQDAGVRFIVKAKNKEDRLAVLALCGSSAIPANLDVSHALSLEELLPRSRLVVGFNSMALFDALFTAAPLAVPDMLDTRRGLEYLMFDPQDSLCAGVLHFYRQPQELDALLDAAAGGRLAEQQDGAERRALIGRYVHFPEAGSAAELVERFVSERLRRAPARSGGARRVAA